MLQWGTVDMEDAVALLKTPGFASAIISGILPVKIIIYTRNKISNQSDVLAVILFDWFQNKNKQNNCSLVRECAHARMCVYVCVCVCICSRLGRGMGVCKYSSSSSSMAGHASDQLHLGDYLTGFCEPLSPLYRCHTSFKTV